MTFDLHLGLLYSVCSCLRPVGHVPAFKDVFGTAEGGAL